jgi:hypothetical protein
LRKPTTLLLLAAGVGLGLHLLFAFYLANTGVRVGGEATEEAQVVYTGERWASEGEILRREQAALLDSAPLFMPTPWNQASDLDEVASLREATEVFGPYPAAAELPGNLVSFERDDDLEEETDGGVPGLLAAPDSGLVLAVLGRQEAPLPEAEAVLPSALVLGLSGEGAGYRERLSLSEELAERQPAELWSPPSFYLQVRYGSPVGVPTLAGSSGYPQWDQQLRDYLGEPRFWHRWPDGYYRVRIYP